ncbi:MAG TPA: protein kinase, partial [Vicinamibacterales bacterium]|nr:protein kinase [Vicinamibacterales bacterium]
MPNSSWHRAKQMFNEALDKTGAERARFVVEACGNDHALRAEVEKLLAAHDEAGGFLDRPTAEAGAAAAAAVRTADRPEEGPGTRIGPYKLLQQIGEGGFGVVYMAEQETPIRRRVALKIIKPGMDTRQVIARFESERQALALMDHPNIARVLDAGATESGRPYFVMELVKGVPLTDYCDANHLSTRERLELFVQVCQAVHHAHEKGIIHRDIKPSNVMVTLHDGTPVPKIIDFGVAKATSQRLTEKTLFTAYGVSIGTPTYMSPEQAEMSGLEIDRRSDVYSLGVLLYELLTGTTPLDAEALRTAAYVELLRLIREQEPPTPSARLSTLGGQLAEIARNRHAEPHTLTRLVRGDLDWIVMKALDKDRRRRYLSASDLARDLSRFFANEPVTARRPSPWYRAQKFTRRHAASLAAAASIALALVIGGGLVRFGAVDVGGAAPDEAAAPAGTGPAQRFVSDRDQERAFPTRDGRHALRYNGSVGSFELVDLATQEVRQLTRPGFDPGEQVVSHQALSPDGRTVAAVLRHLPGQSASGAELRLIREGEDGSGRRLYRWENGVVPRVVDWSADGSRIWLMVGDAGGASQIASVGIADGSIAVLKTMRWHRATQAPSLSPDGEFLVYHDADGEDANPDVLIIASDGSREVRLEHPAADRNPMFVPDGSGIVFLSDRGGNQDLWFQPVSNGQPKGEPRVVFEDIGPAGTNHRFSDDGTLYYSFSTTTWEVYTAALAGGDAVAPRRIVPRPNEMNTAPAFSPDNRYLGYLRDRGRRLVLRDLATETEREIPIASRLIYMNLAFCPDGEDAVVTGLTSLARYVAYRLDLAHGGVEPLTLNSAVNAVCLGADIVYVQQNPDGRTRTLMRRSTGTGTDAVLHAASVSDSPLARSPDGSRIAFMEWGETEARVMTMSASGGEAVEVATTPVERFAARSFTRLPGVMWLPGGRDLLIVRGADGRQGEWDFIRVSADGGAETRIGRMRTEEFETGFYGIMHLRLSADGTMVAFHQNTGTVSQMWAID